MRCLVMFITAGLIVIFPQKQTRISWLIVLEYYDGLCVRAEIRMSQATLSNSAALIQ